MRRGGEGNAGVKHRDVESEGCRRMSRYCTVTKTYKWTRGMVLCAYRIHHRRDHGTDHRTEGM
jgi:hypothetical protein